MKNLDTMEFLPEIEMSNFDHTIDEGLEEVLRANPARKYAQHSAWDFCGYVWFENGKFFEQVWRYKAPIDELEANDLKELMLETNLLYGSE